MAAVTQINLIDHGFVRLSRQSTTKCSNDG
jgi:hypothetical protein